MRCGWARLQIVAPTPCHTFTDPHAIAGQTEAYTGYQDACYRCCTGVVDELLPLGQPAGCVTVSQQMMLGVVVGVPGRDETLCSFRS